MAETGSAGGGDLGQQQGDAYVARYNWEEPVPLSVFVVETVQSFAGPGRDVNDNPLYYSIDPDALDRLFEPHGQRLRNSCRVSFEFAGYRVTVCGDGEVRVSPQPAADGGVEDC
jgi:hypothetical protein